MDNQQLSVQPDPDLPEKSPDAAVRQMRIRIGLLPQPKSMRSIIDATQRECQYGLA